MISVDEFSDLIKNSLSTVQNIKVYGEIGKITKSSKQHLYFELKSKNAVVSCVVWSSFIKVESGQAEVLVKKMDFYPPYGKCQAIVTNIEQSNKEDAQIATQRSNLIDILHKEGVVDRVKHVIPDIIKHLVIITSHNSAAHFDMKQGVDARWPELRTTVIHTSVQGPDSLVEIPLAFNKAYDLNPDVIICGRGGGSESDLQVFNEEIVVRSFIHSSIPIISAIGHESDHSISDIVADVRAKTPTAAIEIAIKYTKQEILENISNKFKQLLQVFQEYIKKSYEKNENLERSLHDSVLMNLNYLDRNTQNKKIVMKEHMDKIWARCTLNINEKYITSKYETGKFFTDTKIKYIFDNLKILTENSILKFEHSNTIMNKDLNSFSPLNSLKRGFAFVTKDGLCVKNIDNLKYDDELCVNFINGKIDVIVKKCRTS